MSPTTRRPARPRPSRSPAPTPSRRPLVVAGIVVAVVLAALVAALVAGSGSDDDTETSDPSGGTPAAVADDTPATVAGTPLPALPDDGPDPAVGAAMPTLSGTALDGEPVTIPADGRPTMIVYLAHWCPHCQAEVPVVQRWVDEGRLPDGVDLVAVSTAADERRPNYPPAAWLEREGWTARVLVDGDDAAATASGVSAFPFFVAVDGGGTVVARTSGELTPEQLDALAATLAESAP
ncbi:MAG TPA: TlpA disulfide reductase family protein [Acidimicrobiales bacterium]|nr:TlpA disulfide reductase family protein [Acidimicrobiales bacterium]